MIYSLVSSLIVTVIIEVTTAFVIGINEKKDIAVVILVNIITNPVVVFTTNLSYNITGNIVIRNVVITTLEIAAAIAEAVVFGKYLKSKRINSCILSVCLNSVSFASRTNSFIYIKIINWG